MNNKQKVYVIIPAYNEVKRIGKVIDSISKYKLPVVVVDDGSEDNTFMEAKEHGAIVLRHKINLGKSKGAALKTGCEYVFSQPPTKINFSERPDN